MRCFSATPSLHGHLLRALATRGRSQHITPPESSPPCPPAEVIGRVMLQRIAEERSAAALSLGELAIKEGIVPDSCFAKALLQATLKEYLPERGAQFLEELHKTHGVTPSWAMVLPVVMGFNKVKQPDKALALFNSAVSPQSEGGLGLKPNKLLVLNVVLNSCLMARRKEEALRLWQLCTESGVIPTGVSLRTLRGVLGLSRSQLSEFIGAAQPAPEGKPQKKQKRPPKKPKMKSRRRRRSVRK
eukprot:TRINITY_DN69369_c0_g1_i1.p1 TRINITY_DN69369_c0_g1~~TRINITY_DN69369_c0_g1_i1.p1  ORF type:complete len:244 (+),score=20.26 TRINITY_DN69369_c0_g1_i1:24-755(+)